MKNNWAFPIIIITLAGVLLSCISSEIAATQTPIPTKTAEIVIQYYQTITPEVKTEASAIPEKTVKPAITLTPKPQFDIYHLQGQKDAISECFIDPDGKGWAVSKDASWYWDGQQWNDIPWPDRYFPKIYVSLGGISVKDIWVASDVGVLHWNGKNWQHIPSPIDGFQSDKYKVLVAPIVTDQKSLWVDFTVRRYTVDGDIIDEDHLIHWKNNNWVNFPLNSEISDEGNYPIILGDKYIWMFSKLYFWDGIKWEKKPSFDLKGELSSKYNHQVDNSWLLMSSNDHPEMKNLYYWKDEKWMSIGELEINNKDNENRIAMKSSTLGWITSGTLKGLDFYVFNNGKWKLFNYQAPSSVSYQAI